MLRLWLVMMLGCFVGLALLICGALLVGQMRHTLLFAYVAVCNRSTDIFLADFSHRISLPLTRDGASKGDIHWSPNGDFLAYTTSLGIHMITPGGYIEQVTQVADYNISWADDQHLLFVRRDEEQGIWYDPYIINIDTHEVQPSEYLPSGNFGTNWTTKNEVGIFQWQADVGGTDDLYITDAIDMHNIQERFTTDGSVCYEYEPQFRP